MSNTVCPSHKVVTYTNDVPTGRFLKDPAIIPFTEQLPEYLEIPDPPDKVGMGIVCPLPNIHGLPNPWLWVWHTGVDQWWVCDYMEVRAGQLVFRNVLFHFGADGGCTVFYFTDPIGLEKINSTDRMEFARSVIPLLNVPALSTAQPSRP